MRSLEEILSLYRGTGRITRGHAEEFSRRYNTVIHAQSMTLPEWIAHCSEVSRNEGVYDGTPDYDSRNIVFWTETWEDAQEGMVHFCRKFLHPFLEDGMISVLSLDVYDFSAGHEDDPDRWRYDLVRITA